MRRTFEITLPNVSWKNFLTIRYLALVVGLGIAVASFYWWKNVYPFFKIEKAALCTSSMEIRSAEAGLLVHCPLNEGDVFQRGQTLFSLDKSTFVNQLKEIDRKITAYRQQIDQAKHKVDQSMEQYLYLQNELSLEGKTSEVLDQILAEAQKMQGNCFQIEKELSLLQNDRIAVEQVIGKSSFIPDFEGIILRRFKQAGDAISDGEPIFLISNSQNRWIEAEIPEKMLLQIKVGSLASIELPSFPKRKWSGQVSWISPIAQEGKLKIRMTAENLPAYSGLTAKALIKTN